MNSLKENSSENSNDVFSLLVLTISIEGLFIIYAGPDLPIGNKFVYDPSIFINE